MTFNAASRLRSLEDRSAALGSRRCELPGMHSVPKSAVLPYASGVGGLSRRLLNKPKKIPVIICNTVVVPGPILSTVLTVALISRLPHTPMPFSREIGILWQCSTELFPTTGS